ncbi:MAG: efflux RND transporter periplasmic adaptor subunit [Nitrospirae bacterium]|nr:efflux RND transporter periplasmic adaptor subunit [Nitrospirota bacterium]
MMMTKTTTWIIGGTAGIGLLFLGVAALKHMVRTDATKARLVHAGIPVEIQPAGVATMNEIIGASGSLLQENTATLTSRVAALVQSVPVELGQLVLKDQVLTQFDSRLLEAAVVSAKEKVEEAQVQLYHAQQQLERLTILNEQGVVAKSDVEQAQVQAATGKLNLASARQALIEAEIAYDHAVVKSPVNAILLDRYINPGENVKVGDRLFTIGTIDRVFMVAHVGEEKIASVQIEQEGEVTLDSFPGEIFHGRVVKIDPTTDSKTRTFSAYIRMDNPTLRFKPGLTGFGRIRRLISTLVVPNTAIINPVGDRMTLYIVDGTGTAHLRSVRTGIVSDGMTQILEGLTEGERVVTVGQLYLRDNDRVQTNGTRDPNKKN